MPKKLKDGSEVLTEQEDAFCYAFCEIYNQTKAAIAAGYGRRKDGSINERAAAQQGWRLRQNELIKQRINEIMTDAANEVGATRYFIAKQLKETADRCMELKPELEWNSEERKMIPTGGMYFNARDAISALKTLAEIQGMKTMRIGNAEGESLDITVDAATALEELGWYEKRG